MRHPTANWHLLNSANYSEFVMVLPMAASTRILHVTCYTHVLLIWILWAGTELRRDPSQWDSLEFSIHIPPSLWVIPVLSDCMMSLAPSPPRPQHIQLRPLVTRRPPHSSDHCESCCATRSLLMLEREAIELILDPPKNANLCFCFVILIDSVPLLSQKGQILENFIRGMFTGCVVKYSGHISENSKNNS